MSDYRIVVQRSPKRIRERFHVAIVAANGRTLFTSENLKNVHYARELGHQIAQALDANFIDLTD